MAARNAAIGSSCGDVDHQVGTEVRRGGEAGTSRSPAPVTMTKSAPASLAAAAADRPTNPAAEHGHHVAGRRCPAR